MSAFAINWKTSASGAAMIFGAFASLAHSYGTGAAIDIPTVFSAFMGGIGLLMAKDQGVTGGTKSAVTGDTISTPVSLIGS